MIFLVVESSQSVRESLCYVLLSFGIRGIPAPSRRPALQALETEPGIEGAIVDIDNHDVEGIQLVHEIKENERTRGLTIIVHTLQSSKEFVMQMVELGVAGYLLKPFNQDAAKTKLTAILGRLQTHNSQRKHIRVRPDPDDLARVSFRLPQSPQLQSGRIIDISLGGMAVELFNPPTVEQLATGAPVSRLEFNLAGKALTPPASVVLYKSQLLALRFDGMSDADKRALERYIFRRISS